MKGVSELRGVSFCDFQFLRTVREGSSAASPRIVPLPFDPISPPDAVEVYFLAFVSHNVMPCDTHPHGLLSITTRHSKYYLSLPLSLSLSLS